MTSGVRQVCRCIRTPCAEFRACAPRSLGAVRPGASSARRLRASAARRSRRARRSPGRCPWGLLTTVSACMDASAPDERTTPVTCVLIFFGRSVRPGVRHQDRCATVCAQTSAGKAPPARSTTVTDRAATQLSRRAVAAGKQRRGRAARPPRLRIPADDAAFPSVISIRFQSFLNFVLEVEFGCRGGAQNTQKSWKTKIIFQTLLI